MGYASSGNPPLKKYLTKIIMSADEERTLQMNNKKDAGVSGLYLIG